MINLGNPTSTTLYLVLRQNASSNSEVAASFSSLLSVENYPIYFLAMTSTK